MHVGTRGVQAGGEGLVGVRLDRERRAHREEFEEKGQRRLGQPLHRLAPREARVPIAQCGARRAEQRRIQLDPLG